LPTTLPPRRPDSGARTTARLVFDVLFNGAMLVSALILALIVMVREEQFAFSQQQIADQAMQQRVLQPSGEGQFELPSR